MATIQFKENAEFNSDLMQNLLQSGRVSNPIKLASQETGEIIGRKYICTGDGGTRLIIVIWNGENVSKYYGGKMYFDSEASNGKKQYFRLRAPLEMTDEVCMDFCVPTAAEVEAAKRSAAAQKAAATRAANRAAKRS